MLNRENDTHDEDMDFIDFEFPPVPDESLEREPKFAPISGGNIPQMPNYPGGNFPGPGFNFPGGNFYKPDGGFTPPGMTDGGFTPPGMSQYGMPQSPPPSYIPSKTDKGVQSFKGGEGQIGTKAVSSGSIRFCLYKFTYIWEKNGRSYWTFLFNVDRDSVSGFRWFGRRWVYFGLSLKRIDSFVCYRSSMNDECEDCKNLRQDNKPTTINKKDHYLNGTRDVCTYTLASLEIPEVKEDSITQTIGYIDDESIQTEVPCVKTRNIEYRINLEVTYPSNYEPSLKKEINELCDETSAELYNIISATRDADESSTPLENFNSSLVLIPELLNTFTNSFTSKFNLINSSRFTPDITWAIREEKSQSNWKPCLYNSGI